MSGLMNASHDPQSCSTCSCFPVQPAYNFYCHGKEITAVCLLLLFLPPFLCVSDIPSTLTASLLHAPASISVKQLVCLGSLLQSTVYKPGVHEVATYFCVLNIMSGFGGLEVACWPVVPKFAGWNPAEAVGFLRVNKNPQHVGGHECLSVVIVTIDTFF